MKSLKVLGIIGIILASLGLMCCFADDYGSGFAVWLFLNSSFLMAQSIVGIVKYNKHKF